MAIPMEISEAELDEVRALLPRSAQDYADNQARYDALFPTCPDAVGVPAPGPDFARLADAGVPDCYRPLPLAGLKGDERARAVARNETRATKFARCFATMLRYHYLMALYCPRHEVEVDVKGRRETAQLMPGTFRTYKDAAGVEERIPGWGPSRARVLVVATNPGIHEIARGENFVGPASDPLARAIAELQMPGEEYAGWYWTNLVKHPPLDKAGSLPRSHIKNMLPLLAQELRLVRPDYVLCLGDVASKEVLGPKLDVAAMFGRVLDLPVPLHAPGEEPAVHVARAMACCHPAKVFHRPEAYADLIAGLSAFRALVAGQRTGEAEPDIAHVVVYTEDHLRRVVGRVLADTPAGAAIAVDCEWHGNRPGDPGSYLRTIQFSHRPKFACCVVLRHQGGRVAFRPGVDSARPHLLRLLKSTPDRPVRIGGHYLTADFPWLQAYGVDLLDEFTVAPTPASTRAAGGWDTHRMVHAAAETMPGGYKLENLAARFCAVPRYDVEMQAWKDGYCAVYKLKDKELGGYGECPDNILHPYACYDADATMRLFEHVNGPQRPPGGDESRDMVRVRLLDADQRGLSSRAAFWLDHAPVPAILEMEETGLLIDRARGDFLTDTFIEAYDNLLAAFRERINWTASRDAAGRLVVGGFSPASAQQCRELLYGVEWNSVIDTATGLCRRLSPPGARLLGLTPIMASGKRPKPWEQVLAAGQEGLKGGLWPATNKEVLGTHAYFAHDKETRAIVAHLRDLRFINRVLSGALRRPWRDAAGNIALSHDLADDDADADYTDVDSAGEARIYDGGLMHFMGADDRVRTHFGLVETGRWSSWGPNIQNISKRREGDYRRILGTVKDDGTPAGDYLDYLGRPMYPYPIRSIIRAPDGCVLVEADYKMAELAMLGWLAGDATMMDHVRRNMLKEEDPEYLDIHSMTAINAFKLDTPANREIVAHKAATNPKFAGLTWGYKKNVLKALGMESLRVAAKNVNFGASYGRSAPAITRQCREEGTEVTDAESQALLDNYFATYAQVAAYLAKCVGRVLDPGWMIGTFGRPYRFQATDDEAVLGELQRAAMNRAIQGGVADCIDLACRELFEYRREHGRPDSQDRWFRFALQIHDALLFEVPIPALEWFLKDVLEECMSRRVPIVPRDLDGNVIPGVGPYHLGIDSEFFRYWGEEVDHDWAVSVGIPETLLKH